MRVCLPTLCQQFTPDYLSVVYVRIAVFRRVRRNLYAAEFGLISCLLGNGHATELAVSGIRMRCLQQLSLAPMVVVIRGSLERAVIVGAPLNLLKMWLN